MICYIIPPHILNEIKKHGDETQRAWAERSLTLSEEIRQKRKGVLTVNQAQPSEERSPLVQAEKPNKNRIIYTANITTDLPGISVRTEGQPAISDISVNQAYDGTGATYDLYYNIYQRNSINNKGMSLVSTVHYSMKYDNAFWDGSQMVYGDGDGELFGAFTKPIDVTGHELTHGVTQYSANLNYQDQSGALNESFSDVFGTLVKQHSLNQSANEADWLIGQGIFTARVHGIALRSMKAPGTAYDDPVIGRDPQPADMSHFVKTSEDNGGVHINSGIPNHAFYLTAFAIGGNAWESSGKIWYETLTKKLKPGANFADCAAATVEAAGELFGDGSKVQSAVQEAWKQVEVL